MASIRDGQWINHETPQEMGTLFLHCLHDIGFGFRIWISSGCDLDNAFGDRGSAYRTHTRRIG